MYPVAVGTQGNALSLGFVDSFRDIVFDHRKFIYRPLTVADYVVKVDNGRVAEATVGTLLFCLVSLPLLAFDLTVPFVSCYLSFAVF